jgi:hypothetical protein
VRASSYPNLITEDFTTISVVAVSLKKKYNLKGTVDSLARFGRSLCQNFATLQAQGHPKWREVSLKLPELGPGWTYYPATAREIRACAAGKPKAQAKPVRKCTPEENILGLCN